jgi:hypothetical protein
MGDFNIREMMNKVLKETVFSKPLKKELIAIFNDLVPMYVPSGSEAPVIEYASGILMTSGFDVVVDTAGNIEATRGFVEGDKLVAINAHTDTVQRKEDEGIAKGSGGALYNWIRDEFISEGFMIGGDDKCGVAVGLCLAQHTDLPMKIIFTTGEEVGGVGMKALRKEAWDNVAFCFTVDRMHGTDLISRYCGRACAPKEFVTAFVEIAKNNAGVMYTDTSGSWADTYEISSYVPAVNLSAGYYNPHTSRDFIKCDEMYKTMMAIKAAIENKAEIVLAIASAPADWQTVKAPYYGYGGYTSRYGGYYEYYGEAGTSGRDDWNLFGEDKDRDAMVRRGGMKTRPQRRGQTSLGTTYGGRGGLPPRSKDYKKCKIDFKDRDDKEEKIHVIEMNPDEEEIVASYVDDTISDNEWDGMLKDGIITTILYNVGIDLKIEAEHNRKVQDALVNDDDGALLDLEDEALEREIEKCEYLPGSVEWQVYSDYLIGAIGYSDLSSYAVAGTVSWDLVKCATKAKERLAGSTIGKEIENWKKEAQEERDYFENKQKLDRSNELSPFEQEGLLDEFVDGVVDDAEWELYLKKGKISKSIYDAGFIERSLSWKGYDKPKPVGKKKPAEKTKTSYVPKLLPVKQVQDIIKNVASGKIPIETWKKMWDKGQVTTKEYSQGVEARKTVQGLLGKIIGKKSEVKEYAKTAMGEFEKQNQKHVEKYVAGKYNEYEWDRMHDVGTITDFYYKKGREIKEGTKKAGIPLVQEGGVHNVPRMQALVKEFVAGHISEAHWNLMLTTGSITKGAHAEGLAKWKQAHSFKIKNTPPKSKTLPSDKKIHGNDLQWLEYVRKFALGEIGTVEWEHMISKREIPLWVYNRGYVERKHYIANGYFTDYMNKRSVPPKVKAFEEPEGVPCNVCEEMIDKFVTDKITYTGWLMMRASGEISDETFTRGLEKSGKYDIPLAKIGLNQILKQYNKDFDTFEDQMDAR